MTPQDLNCAHPLMCLEEDSFKERIKTDKLALESPPPSDLVKPPE